MTISELSIDQDSELSLCRDQENERNNNYETNEPDPGLLAKLHYWLSVKRFCLLLAGLLAFSFLLECLAITTQVDQPFLLQETDHIRIQALEDEITAPLLPGAASCSPALMDPSRVTYRSEHAFYTMLQSGLLSFPPPVFQGKTTKLCDGNAEHNRSWEYCLPITGRRDVPFCQSSSRSDLLNALTDETRCFASVLHMLLVDVYDEMKHQYAYPAVLYSTLLGAVREGRTLPLADSIDVGYHMENRSIKKLRSALADKGYHMFHQETWHVCVAPTHPLASNLYDPVMHLVRGAMEAPYVDLYEMKAVNRTTWRIANSPTSPYWPRDRIAPFSQVTLLGMEFDTVADPAFFLKREYGDDYMTPKGRKAKG